MFFQVRGLAVLSLLCSGLALSEDANTDSEHTRTARQLHRIIDPFGLLDKAGEAVSGAVEDFGKRLDEGAQHMGRVVQQGAASLDSAFKHHVKNVQAGLEEAGKVASIVGEDIVDSVHSLVNNHMQDSVANNNQGNVANNNQQGNVANNNQGNVVNNHLQEPDEAQPEAMRRDGGAARKESSMIDSFFRMFGVDSSQIGLMALNVLIFLAEMITSSLIGEDLNEIPESRNGETSVLSWFLKGHPRKIDAMLREAQDPALPRAIIEKLQRATGDETACVQLLVCKMSPLVWGLQRTVKDNTEARSMHPERENPGILQTLYNALPPLNDFVTFSESCEKQFPACPLIHLTELFS